MKNYLSKLHSWKLAIISGVLIGISFHQICFGILVYIGFIPLLHSWFRNNPKNNLFSGYVFGVTYNLISNYWMATNSGAEFIVVLFSLIAATLYLSIFWAFAGFIVGLYKNISIKVLIMPFLVVSLEWIRSFGPLGFAWGNLALTQMDMLHLLQFIDYGGTYIITFLIVCINSIIYYHFFLKSFPKQKLVFFLAFLLLINTIGLFRLNMELDQNNNTELDIAVIQPNLNPNEKWDRSTRELTLNLMDSLHQLAIGLNPDIILFPETALPAYLRLNNSIRKRLQSEVNKSNIPILIGTVDRRFDDSGKKLYFNSSMYLYPNKDYQMYDKIHLVPFAEYDLMPYILHPLGQLNLNIDRGIFMGGDNYVKFSYEKVTFSNLICYESSLPRYARRFIKDGSNFLMVQANDGWLGKSAGPYQHFELARLRAIENRVPIVRSGNTGISGIIMSNGEVKKKIPLGEQVVFKEKIILGEAGSFYTKYGDVFASLCFVILLFINPVLLCLKK
tara:strand:+ start:2252 stop:3760 length:1509 start_codon:yes stop_codon:yes gene_type:complete